MSNKCKIFQKLGKVALVSMLFTVGLSALSESSCNRIKGSLPYNLFQQTYIAKGKCKADTASSDGFKRGLNIMYDSKVMFYSGQFPAYSSSLSEAKKQCKSEAGTLLSIEEATQYIKEGKFKSARSSDALVVYKGDEMVLIGSKSAKEEQHSWGSIYCNFSDDSASDFKEFGNATFRQTMNDCASQGKGLLSSAEAEKVGLIISAKIKDGRYKMKMKSKDLGIIIVPYANSASDYGYVYTKLYAATDKSRTKPINTDSSRVVTTTASGVPIAMEKVPNIGLDATPTDYYVTYIVSNGLEQKMDPSKYNIFGSCKDNGALLK